MLYLRRWVLAAWLAAGVAACGGGGSGGADGSPGSSPDAGSTFAIDSGFPPPRDDLVPAVGSDDAVDFATWNIRNFPRSADSPRLVADLITSMELDFVAVQEIADVAAFEEVVARLPRHDGLLSSHSYGDGTYQKLGFIYRTDVISISGTRLLFDNQWNAFPRPPLLTLVSIDDGVHSPMELTVIAVHLKAGGGSDDRDRREAAVLLLEEFVRGEVTAGQEPELLVLGDFNEVLTDSAGRTVMAPWLTAPALYDVRTRTLADSGTFSYVPAHVMLDHAVTTVELRDELSAGSVVVPRLDQQLSGYEDLVSDHLPVVVRMPVLR